jgi:tRNA A37 N6-isopentenylltransferase MiaA
MIKEDANTGQSETSGKKVQGKKKVAKTKKKSKIKSHRIDLNMWLDNVDVKQILRISESTLARLRKSEKIPYLELGGKIYYPRTFFEDSMLAKMKNKHLIEKK